MLIAAAALTVVLVAVIAGLAVRRSRSVGESPARRRDLPLVRRLVRSSARPEISEGIRAAFGGNRGAAVVVASGTIATAVFLAAVVFGTSLSALVSTPRSYGWPWDLGVMVNFGYGGRRHDRCARYGRRSHGLDYTAPGTLSSPWCLTAALRPARRIAGAGPPTCSRTSRMSRRR